MCHQQQTHDEQPGYVEEDRDPVQKILLWEKVCQSLWGVIWSSSCIEWGSGWCQRGSWLALNSCCAHCDKIERGIERNRRHNEPVFRLAEPPSPSPPAASDSRFYSNSTISSVRRNVNLGSAVFRFCISVNYVKIFCVTPILISWATFLHLLCFMDNRIRQQDSNWYIFHQNRVVGRWDESLELQKCFCFELASFAISAIITSEKRRI